MFEFASIQEVEIANGLMRSILNNTKNCQFKDTTWCFIDGNFVRETYVLPLNAYETLFIAFTENETKYLTSFAISEKPDFISPNAEINIPKVKDNRSSGCLIKDENNHFYLAHKGRFTAGKSIALETTFSYFEQTLSLDLIQVNEMQLIKAVSLNEDEFVAGVIQFTAEIKTMKEIFKSVLKDPLVNALVPSPTDVSMSNPSSAIGSDKLIDVETVKEIIIQGRIGQQIFRNNLLKMNDSRCQVTGIHLPALLKASHIKPWSESTDSERLDANNGLLLAAHVDTLFDQGLISFDDEGVILFATSEVKMLFAEQNIPNKPIQMNKKTLSYMKWHRRNIFKG